MRAIVQERYGSPDDLELKEIAPPTVDDDGVLVRVRAVSLNAADWHLLRGRPFLARLMMGGLRRPTRRGPGADLAGRVEAIGKNVTSVAPGDEVFGAKGGACAEYVVARERHLVPKPSGLTYEQAAAVPTAGLTALQGFRDIGRLQPGQRVLINGASGGVGTFAVQIAKAFGADVTAVCSTRNVERAHSLGAGRVIDYTRDDFIRSGPRYDLIFDVAGNRPLSQCQRILAPEGTLVMAGVAGTTMGWLGPLPRMAQALVLSRFTRQKFVPFIAKVSHDDLVTLAALIEAGKVAPVIERTYPLSETAAALRYLGAGHAQGKLIILV